MIKTSYGASHSFGAHRAFQTAQGDRLSAPHLAESCSLPGEVRRVSCGGSDAQQKWLLAEELRGPRAVVLPQTLPASSCHGVKLLVALRLNVMNRNGYCACSHELLLYKSRGDCRKGLAEQPWLIQLPSLFR